MRPRLLLGTAMSIVTVLAAGTPSRAAAQSAWKPSAGHTQIPIWPGAIPDPQPVAGPERAGTVVDKAGHPKPVGGKPWIYVDRVSRPTMTVYSPTGANTGAAAVVFPGGGYEVLAIDLEGTEVCDWLTSRGITCVLLKYRVPCVHTGPYRECRMALEDAQRTLGLVRFHVDFALSNPDVIRVQDRDLTSLTDADHVAVRSLQRTYVELWVQVLSRLHPGADAASLRIRAHAVFGLINSTPHSARAPGPDATRLSRTKVGAILEQLAGAALLAPA